jgi:hypothetical protein
MNRLAVSVVCAVWAAELALFALLVPACADIAQLGGAPPASVSAPDAAEAAASDGSPPPSDAGHDEGSVADGPVADGPTADGPVADGPADSASLDAGADGPVDAAGDVVPASAGSCLDVLHANPDAGSGVYSILVDGNTVDAYCDMELDQGGWTTFFVGLLGGANVFAHFEDPTDTCPSPETKCLRHPPRTITPANEFAVKCGADAIRFQAPGTVVEYWELGVSSAWQTLSGQTPIAGNPTVAYSRYFFTGEGPNWSHPNGVYEGWVIASDYYNEQDTFGGSAVSLPGQSWDWCNGVSYADADAGTVFPTVWLGYR